MSTNHKLLMAHLKRVSLVPFLASHTSRTTLRLRKTTHNDAKSQETRSRSKRLQVQRCDLRRGMSFAIPALAKSSAPAKDRMAALDSSLPLFGIYICMQMKRVDQ